MGGFAWVTLATNDSYSLGALVLAHSLRNANTAHKLAVLITPAVSPPMKEQLSTVFDVVKVVDVLDSKDEAHLALMKRPELGVTFTKIHCWRLTEFEKCVFLDADTLVIKNCDELFDREELSAAPDVGWPDCFNTGVFVFKPSIETFDNLVKFSLENGSFDGGDQGLLNQFFGDWATKDINKHLPFVYNLTSVAVYSYIPAFKQYGSDVRIVHFIGSEKPWLQQPDPQTRSVYTGPGSEHLAPMLQIWWNIFCDKVHPSMTTNLECDSGMRNNEIEACVNDNLVEPEHIQPFTPYLDDDDSRQINLPYQHFDVMSSTGELLNITYLEKLEEEMMEEKKEEEKEKREEVREEVNEEWNRYEGYKEPEKVMEQGEEVRNDAEVVENGLEEHSVVEEQQPPTEEPSKEETIEPSPFNHETFFPDEACVQNYLEQNIMTYQPLDHYEKKQDIVNAPEQEQHLPRFLTIAEDDKRQSLNCWEDLRSSNTPPEESNQHSSDNQNQTTTQTESIEECHVPETSPEPVKPLWNSVPNPVTPAPKPIAEVSFWKTHPNLNDPNRKYSMPKLKPILPKQTIPQLFVSDARPKITQYTEFHMSCNYPDAVPCDTMGFVERYILEEITQRVPNAETEKLRTLSYIYPLGATGTGKSVNDENEPTRADDFPQDTDCDLSSCERQKGNQPLQNATRKRSNSCFLPVLKPIRPSQSEEPKRKIRANGRSSKERGTKAKIESRKAREKAKAELNIKTSAEPSSVEDILKKLINFSKDYQGYFSECPNAGKKEKDGLLGTVFKKVYSESRNDSPRIQYSKEFEEPLYAPMSPIVNGHSISVGEEVTATMEEHPQGMNGQVEEPIRKTVTSTVGDGQAFDVSTEPEENHAISAAEAIRPDVTNDATMVNGNHAETNGESSGNETHQAVGTVGANGVDIGQLNGTQSPPTYASVVKQGPAAFRTDSINSNTEQPKKRSSKRSRPSRADRKEKAYPSRTSNQRLTVPSPPRTQQPETVDKPDKPDKPANLFTLLPEDDSPVDVTLKSAKRKRKPVPSQSSRRPPARKTNQDRRVVESLATVDDGYVDNSGIAGAIAKLSIQPGGLPGTTSEDASSAQEDYVRRQNWEMGTMDYMGRDSFDNIWSKICETIDGKVTKDLKPDAPSAEVTTPQKEEAAPEKSQGQSPEAITPQPGVVPPAEGDASAGADKISSEIAAKASDIASKATEALEAFGKLFVSGPVAIKSEVAEDAVLAAEKKEEPQADETVPTERKKSTEMDEEGKQKKGVINKILELVGVGKPETSTAVFYDTEGEQPKEDRGKSVFYDTETPPGVGEEPKMSAVPAEDAPKVRGASPSLIIKPAPGTEVVCPTPPSTPMTPQVMLKDEKMLVVDDTIKATPPVTDKKFDDVPKPSDKDAVKSEVDSIIDEAKKLAEGQLQEPKKEGLSPAPSTSMALVPRLNDALEVFGKLFVSGPVTIKSEVQEENIPKPAIPMPGIPSKTTDATASVTPEAVPGSAETAPVPQSGEGVDTTAAGAPKAEEPVVNITELAAAAVEAVSAVLAKVTDPTGPGAPQPTEPTTPVAPQTVETPAQPAIQQATEPASPVAPQTAETPAQPVPQQPTEPVVPQAVEPPEQPVTPQTTEPATPATPQTAETPAQPVTQQATATPVVPQAAETPAQPVTPQATEPATPVTPQAAETPAQPGTPQPTEPVVPQAAETPAQPVTVQPTEPFTPVTPQAAETPAQTGTPQPTEPPTPATAQPAETPAPVPQPETPKPSEPVPSATSEPQVVITPATPKAEVPPTLTETPKPPEPEPTQPEKTDEPVKATQDPAQPPSALSKENEALEAFGKHFVSGPVTLKSEVPEPAKPATPEKPESEPVAPAKDPEPSAGHSKTSEALEAFGKSFVSGPVVLKSEVPEETKTPGEAETDAVHRAFQAKPEEEPIYSNIEEVEEIKVTSEEDRRKEKPQTSKLTEQILKAIPPELRKPFSEAAPEVSPEVAQLLSSAEQQTTSILLDQPEEAPAVEQGDAASAPPVPPRRNRSKGRDGPLPPPKKKGKNGKD